MKHILNEHKVTHIQFGRFHVMHRIYIGGYLGLIFRGIEHRKGEQQMNFGNNMAMLLSIVLVCGEQKSNFRSKKALVSLEVFST